MNPLYHDHPDATAPACEVQPTAESAKRHAWLVKVKEHMEILFAQDPNLFLAGNLCRHPVPDPAPAPAGAEQSHGDPPADPLDDRPHRA